MSEDNDWFFDTFEEAPAQNRFKMFAVAAFMSIVLWAVIVIPFVLFLRWVL